MSLIGNKDIKPKGNPSISKQYLVQSTQENTSEPSSPRDTNLRSALKLPYELKINEDRKLYAIPSPKKHSCKESHIRSQSVNQAPFKSNSRFLNMDYHLPRDYKVFDVNLTISPLYDKVEGKCEACIKSLPKLCERCEARTPSPVKMFVNYNKYKTPGHELDLPKSNLRFLSDSDFKRAEKITKSRIDYSPIMKFTETEKKLQLQRVNEQLEKAKQKQLRLNKNKPKKKDLFDDPKFFKQSFNVILKQYMEDM